MLNVIEGGFFSGAHREIMSKIGKRIENGERTYLIVPEQQAVIAEAEAAEVLSASAPLYFEVTNFTRLANTVFRNLGGVGKEYSSSTTERLIMWRALTELRGVLSVTDKGEVSTGLVDRMLGAYKAMSGYGISSEKLSELESMLSEDNGRLKNKTRDLSIASALYKSLLGEKYSDLGDDIDEIIKRLSGNYAFLGGVEFFIEGFTSFTEPQYRLIAFLARHCAVTVHINLPPHNTEAFEYTETREAKRKLLAHADIAGAPKKLIRLGGNEGSEYISEFINQLWRTGGKIDNNTIQFNDEIEIIEAEDPYEECEFIAADIRRRVKLGAKFRDFAVIARRSDSYFGILDTAFEKACVPTFFSARRDATDFEPVKLIYNAFASIAGGFRPDDVISYAKCTPSGITRDECDEFELYVRMWDISSNTFLDGEVWSMNPDGYTVRRSPDTDERLLRVNKTRDAIIKPLLALDCEFKRAESVKDFAASLYNFLESISLADDIDRRAELLRSLGEARLAEEYSSLWDVICSSLDTLVAASGDSKTTRDAFIAQLKIALSSVEIGRIPSRYDSVAVGSADMIRLWDKKHIYVIGLNKGEFPEGISDGGYFSERDKLTLASLGLPIEAECAQKGAREIYVFLRAVAYARESVTLMYTKKNAALGDIYPSDIIGSAIRVSGDKIKIKRLSDMKLSELIYSAESALENIGKFDTSSRIAVSELLRERGHGDTLDSLSKRVDNSDASLSEMTVRELSEGTLALTQSRIDDYNNCPFLYFLKYNLSLKPEVRAEFDSRNVGSFIHAILEGFFGEVTRSKIDLSAIDDARAGDMIRAEAEKYLKLLGEEGGMKRTKREDVLLTRLCRAAKPVVMGLCEEFRGSGFIPRHFELKLSSSRDDLPEPAKFVSKDGGEVYVYGTIDRVDTCKVGDELYVRVVDYKTGKKDFSPADLEKGKNLQMFLYLKAVVETKNRKFLKDLGVSEGKKPIPAGVVYVKTEVGDIKVSSPDGEVVKKAIDDAQKRSGMILAEPEVLNATGVRFAPVRIVKSGAIHGSDIGKAYTREGWEKLTETVGEAVGNIASGIRSGEIAPPKGGCDACEWCKFKPICRSQK